jgi:hypothetical protein
MSVVDKADAIPGRGVVRLGGSGKALADALSKHVEAEIRVTVLGHLQRGGGPTAYDRLLATRFGIPVSTTHTITGAIVGVGATHRLSAVRWGIAGRIVWAWVLTIPASAVLAMVIFLALDAFVKL